MLTTTFKLLRTHDACKDRYTVLRKALKGRKDNEPITMIEILDSNGLADALHALRVVPDEQAAERDRLARLYACWCVRQVWHLLKDERSRAAVEIAELFANGNAGESELYARYRDAIEATKTEELKSSIAASAASWTAVSSVVITTGVFMVAGQIIHEICNVSEDYSTCFRFRAKQKDKFREMFG